MPPRLLPCLGLTQPVLGLDRSTSRGDADARFPQANYGPGHRAHSVLSQEGTVHLSSGGGEARAGALARQGPHPENTVGFPGRAGMAPPLGLRAAGTEARDRKTASGHSLIIALTGCQVGVPMEHWSGVVTRGWGRADKTQTSVEE